MKDLNIWIFVTGLVFCLIVGFITLMIFDNLIFSGLCMVTTSIVYASSLDKGIK